MYYLSSTPLYDNVVIFTSTMYNDNMFFEVIPTTVFRDDGDVLTYQSHLHLQPGQIVLIPLGRKKVVGIVWRRVEHVNFPTKAIIEVLQPQPLPTHLLEGIFWLSQYYLAPLPTCANLMIPSGLTSSTVKTDRDIKPPEAENYPIQPIALNKYQQNALQSLQEASGSTRLLRGVTGSGKTNIYLKTASTALSEQKSVILLVPEIALTSQLVEIFQRTFGNRVVLIHSQQTLTERRQIWLDILRKTNAEAVQGEADVISEGETIADEIQGRGAERKGVGLKALLPRTTASDTVVHCNSEPIVVIGPRSALLAPLGNLGLVLIDESHEGAYYQENAPRYSALRLASFIAQKLHIPCIQGSATPNIVDYHLAKAHQTLVELTTKAKQTAIEPKITIVDLKDRNNFVKNRYFSEAMLTAIKKSLQDQHQTLIFHNRRGSSPLTICEDCGWQALCPNCYLPMTLDADHYSLSCHLCGHQEKVPTSCPECGKTGIIHKGFGTKLLETELSKIFPDAKIARFDGDNKKTDSLAALYRSVQNGEIDILIGTQMLARGLDLPHLATVGIVQADTGLSLPDFAAEERTFELLNQVIGRVGRGHLARAEVIIQTYQPDHPAIQTATKSDFASFAEYLLKKRREQALPPFTYIAKLAITYKTEKTTLDKINQAYMRLKSYPKLSVSPPMPAFHERTRRGFTWQIIIKSTSRAYLAKVLAPYSQFHIELDPPSLL